MTRPKLWIAGALALALIGIAAVVLINRSSGEFKTSEPTVRQLEFDESGLVPISGLEPRAGSAVAWTGSQLLIFGGRAFGFEDRRLRSDGVLVDVERGRSKPLPRAPFAAPLLSPIAASAGDRVVIVGIECAKFRVEPDSDSYSCARDSGRFALSTFDPATQEWSAPSRPPGLDALRSSPSWARGGVEPGFFVPQLLAAGDDRAVVSISRGDNPDLWSYSVGAGSWTKLPSRGASSSPVCTSGTRVASMTGATLQLFDLARPGTGWTRTAPVALAPVTTPDLTCLGDRIMVSDPYRDTGAHLYDMSDSSWSAVAAPPANLVAVPNTARTVALSSPIPPEQRIWTGTELLLLPDLAATNVDAPTTPERAYNPTTNSWRTLEPMPAWVALPQWVGPSVVGYSVHGNRSVVAHYLPG